MEAQQQPQAAEIEATKGELEAVAAMQAELAEATAASDFARVQVLARRLRVKELQQQVRTILYE